MMYENPEHGHKFDEIRARVYTRRTDLKRLFDRKFNDAWPLQHRHTDFDFLGALTDEKRDGEIMRYALHCWTDIVEYAQEICYPKQYFCCLEFESDSEMLWPIIYFKNCDLDELNFLASLPPPASFFSKYIEGLVTNAVSDRKGIFIEQNCSDPERIKIYLDFIPAPNESRLSLTRIGPS